MTVFGRLSMPRRSKNLVTRLEECDPAEAEVAEVGLGRDEGHRRDVGQAGLPDAVVDVEEELVGGAEARAALGGADHDRAGVLQKGLPGLAGQQGVVEVAHRLRVAVFGPEARDLLERQARPGRDQQPIVRQLVARSGGDHVRLGVDAAASLSSGCPCSRRGRRDGRRAEAEWQPMRGDEGEMVARVEHDDLVPLVKVLAQLERGGEAGEARVQERRCAGGQGEHGDLLLAVRRRSEWSRWGRG